jgi:hypothetical protein
VICVWFFFLEESTLGKVTFFLFSVKIHQIFEILHQKVEKFAPKREQTTFFWDHIVYHFLTGW